MKKSLALTAIWMMVVLLFAPSSLAKLDINTASAIDLQSLPRIGPSLANAIIEYREANGSFKSVYDLSKVPGIGDKTVENLKDFITVGGNSGQSKQQAQPGVAVSGNIGSPYEPISKNPSVPSAPPTPVITYQELEARFANEPSVQDVQKAAMRYAHIDPQEFARWRRLVKTRALAPETFQVTVGHDTDDDTDYARGKTISLTGGTVTIGPDDEAWGHSTDNDWDYEVKMKWKLQDFIWNKEMLRVSSETADQVGLRQDILNEITKIYFDRRRLQIDMVLDSNISMEAKIKQELRLQELTAAIDALTGGYFSEQLENNKPTQ